MHDLIAQLGVEMATAAGEAYYVGGAVRDLLLGRPIRDVDFAVFGDPLAAGKAIARRYSGHAFWMRREEGVARVILPQQELQVDVCRLRGTLEEDLLARDLTINALALPAPLAQPLRPIDPAGGLEDLRERRLRFVTPEAPGHDPLRLLRVFRFSATLSFAIPSETAGLVRRFSGELDRVSPERIRDEIFQLLEHAAAREGLAGIDSAGLGAYAVGAEPGNGAGDRPYLARLAAVDALLESAGAAAEAFFSRVETAPRQRRALVRWAATLPASWSGPDALRAARRMVLSNRERNIVERGIRFRGAAMDLLRLPPAAGSDVLRFLQAAGAGAPEAAALCAGAAPDTAIHELLDLAVGFAARPPDRLLTGRQVMDALGLPPGPEIGRLLEDVELARADGRFNTADEALAWLRVRRGAGPGSTENPDEEP